MQNQSRDPDIDNQADIVMRHGDYFELVILDQKISDDAISNSIDINDKIALTAKHLFICRVIQIRLAILREF